MELKGVGGSMRKKKAKNIKVIKEKKEKVTDLFGYVKSQGCNKISSHHPFNNVDAVVLCRISYFPLESYVQARFDKHISVHELGIRMLKIANGEKLGTYEKKDMDLLKIMMRSPRYMNMSICGFHSHFSLRKAEQFAACTIIVNPKVAFVSFRGTDATFNGWKEDFDLGVLGSIPSHNDAMKYVKESMNHFQGKGFIFGGHSKGGNLASYVALNLPKSLREERFIKAYIIDGPGFRKDVLLKGEFESIQDKVVSLAPNQSVVGMILYSPFPVQPVDSKGLIVFQHDVYLWKIQGTDFVRGNFDPISYTVKRWTISIFEDMQVDEIKMTLDVIFDFLQGLYGDTVSDIFAHPWRSLFFFVGGMKGIDENAKTILKKSGKLFMSYYRSINNSLDGAKKLLKASK